MLERLLRRLLWILPSALGVALLTFYALSFVPPDQIAPSSPHHRYRSLPLFFNVSPADVRTATARTLAEILEAPTGSERAKQAGSELVRLGGAALPIIMPRLDGLPVHQRTQVLLALGPLARRMQLSEPADAENPETVLRFWTRFWEASEVEFRSASARNAARRWMQYGDAGRERDMFRLDTFALAALFELLPLDAGTESSATARRALDVIAHVTDLDDRIVENATEAEAAACIARWRHFWMNSRTNFVELRGSDRITAFALESRFGKWALAELTGASPKSESPLALKARVRMTFLLSALGWLAALLLALPLGVWCALHRESRGDRLTASLSWLLFCAGPVVIGCFFARALGRSLPHPGLAFTVLVCVMVARPFHLTRARVTEFLAGNALKAGLARGANRSHVAWREGLRDSIAPVLAGSLLELPSCLTACFVLERVFGLDGLGQATLDAVTHADVGRVMGLFVGMTAWGVLGMMLSDLVLALAEPRTRSVLFNLERRA